jgi:hypothetical protein
MLGNRTHSDLHAGERAARALSRRQAEKKKPSASAVADAIAVQIEGARWK